MKNGKIEQIEKAIADAKKEQTAARQAVKAAASDPEKRVRAEKHEKKIAAQIAALEQAKAAAEYIPPEPADKAELLECLTPYKAGKAEKIEKAEKTIADLQQERQQIAAALQEATGAADAGKVISLSEQRDENAKKLQYAQEMLTNVKALPLYPAGAIAEQWDEIIKRLLPDWNRRVLTVETLAAAYTMACKDLLTMYDTLQDTRSSLEAAAAKDGGAISLKGGAFTAGMDERQLTVNKADYIRLGMMEHPITGRAL